jgi:hypothetical protein
MKTLKSTQTRINQTNNNSLTLKNQKVMKTKKYSISKKAFVAVAFAFVFSTALKAQLDISAGTNTQTPVSEEREENLGTYTAIGTHAVGDQFTWEIWADVAPVSVESGAVDIIDGGSGTSADPYVVFWTDDLSSIDVQWAADASPGIDNTNGNVSVQKRLAVAAGGCLSPIQSWDIDFWSVATASMATADASYCSGAAIGGTVTIDLTGAPDGVLDGFAVDYTITAPDLEEADGTSWDGITDVATSDAGTVTIDLPAELIDVSLAQAGGTFTITLDRMNDDFTGDGTLGDDTFIITVSAIPDTGVIQSTSSLTRR